MIVAKQDVKKSNNTGSRVDCSIDAIIDAMAAHCIDSGSFAALLSLWPLKIAVLYCRDNY